MDTGKFLVIVMGIFLSYNVIMKALNVIDNLINARRYSKLVNHNRSDIDIDEDFKDIV